MGMAAHGKSSTDSLIRTGGEIPGAEGVAAYVVKSPVPSAIPIMIAVPHAGRAYPHSLLERMRNPGFASLRLEDRYVDRLAEAVAAATGATLLVAHAPRAMIDLNRGTDDIDWDMFGRGAPTDVGSYTPGMRARSGLGLIPRRLPGLGELWKRRHDEHELSARLSGIYEPYHQCLRETLGALRTRWGAALLIDLHSMPPLALKGGIASPEFVIGDRFGSTCHGTLVGTAFSYLAEMRRGSAHNRPYAGGHVLQRHAAPKTGVHAFQLEIDRSSYLDSRLLEPGPGFAGMVTLLTGLVQRLAGEVADLGRLDATRDWPQAAE